MTFSSYMEPHNLFPLADDAYDDVQVQHPSSHPPSQRASPVSMDPRRNYRPAHWRDSTPVSGLPSPEISYFPMPLIAGPSNAETINQ